MSSVPEALVVLITGDSTIASYIGDRIYPGVLPPNAITPAMTYNKVAGTGGTTTGPDLAMTRMQFDAYHTSFLIVEKIGQAVYDLLQRYSGTVDGVTFSDMQLDYMQTLYEDETNMHRCLIDYKIWSEGL